MVGSIRRMPMKRRVGCECCLFHEDFKLPSKKLQRCNIEIFKHEMFENFVDVFPSLFQTVSKIHKFLCFCWFLPQKNRLFPTRCYSAGQVEVQSPVGKPVMDQEVRTTSSAKAGKVGTGTDSLMEEALCFALKLVKHSGRNG